MSDVTPKIQSNKGTPKVVIKFEELSKKYGKLLAVDNINLEVREGETIGLVGPNGAGKTTTIKMIARLLRPTHGKIFILNKEGELQDLHKNHRNLVPRGFLIDVPFFYKEMTAYQILRYFAKSQNYPKDKINDRINELMTLFKLSEWKHEKVKTFSKGMRQKLGIIQSMLIDPKILFLDEPQTGLDPKARIEIRRVIRELQKLGKTIFVASHMLYEISEVCDKIALINHGEIIGFDTIENLEKVLKVRELECEILNPVEPERLKETLKLLNERLEPYLDKNLDPEISRFPAEYMPEMQGFKFYYDGQADSVAKILEILITEFKSYFQVISFGQPRTSQLERIYSQVIIEDEPKRKKNNKRKN
jgi:ABC-2 type transport system ATP-binding protein